MKKDYAKVLIIGQNFDQVTGGGITLSNLFSSYPKDKIAVITQSDKSDLAYCDRVYEVGKKESALKLGKIDALLFSQALINKSKSMNTYKSKHKLAQEAYAYICFCVKRVICKALGLISQASCFGYYRLSDSLLKWIEDFGPDVLYTQLGGPQIILFFEQIRKKINKPYVIHIMDDWVQKFPEFQETGGFSQLLNDQMQGASIAMGICKEMAKEYKTKYGREFQYYHNPIEAELWKSKSKNDWSLKSDAFVMMFAGKLGRKSPAIVEVCEAVDDLNRNAGLHVQVHIYTNDSASEEASRLKTLKGVLIFDFVPNTEIIDKMCQADALILPLSFDEDYVRITRLSMPTKTSEYMVSGTPVLVYAHPDTALNKYATEHGWAYVVSERSMNALKSAIQNLYSDINIRSKLGKKAKKMAYRFHDRTLVSKEFSDNINSIA